MRIKLFLFIALLLMITVKTFTQDWVIKFIQESSETGKISNKFPQNLENEMKEFVGTKVQNISFKPVNNVLFSDDIDSYKGKTIIIQFGGTTCSGCKLQMPELSRIQEEYEKRKVQIIFLFSEPKDNVKKYIKDKSIFGIIATLDAKDLLKPFQTIAMPTTYIIDSDGIIRDCWIVPEKYASIEKRLQPILSSTK